MEYYIDQHHCIDQHYIPRLNSTWLWNLTSVWMLLENNNFPIIYWRLLQIYSSGYISVVFYVMYFGEYFGKTDINSLNVRSVDSLVNILGPGLFSFPVYIFIGFIFGYFGDSISLQVINSVNFSIFYFICFCNYLFLGFCLCHLVYIIC